MELKEYRELIKQNKPTAIDLYKKAKRGWREIGGQRVYFKNAWEANAARILTFMKREWQYEIKTFWFEKIKTGTRSYKPDFYLPNENLYIEVKGYWSRQSKTKLKRMAKYYPEVNIEIWDKTFFDKIKKNGIDKLINGWEY
jgi:hypothetical protein